MSRSVLAWSYFVLCLGRHSIRGVSCLPHWYPTPCSSGGTAEIVLDVQQLSKSHGNQESGHRNKVGKKSER